MNVGQPAAELANMPDDILDELLHLGVSAGCIAELGVAQFDGMDVVGAALGIDDQHAASRVAFGLRGEEGGGQLPLAGAAQRIGLRIVGQQRLRLRQSFSDRVRDAGEVVDLVASNHTRRPAVIRALAICCGRSPSAQAWLRKTSYSAAMRSGSLPRPEFPPSQKTGL